MIPPLSYSERVPREWPTCGMMAQGSLPDVGCLNSEADAREEVDFVGLQILPLRRPP